MPTFFSNPHCRGAGTSSQKPGCKLKEHKVPLHSLFYIIYIKRKPEARFKVGVEFAPRPPPRVGAPPKRSTASCSSTTSPTSAQGWGTVERKKSTARYEWAGQFQGIHYIKEIVPANAFLLSTVSLGIIGYHPHVISLVITRVHLGVFTCGFIY